MKNQEKNIQTKLELLNLADKLGNISMACKITGYSRDSFYRFKNLYEKGGKSALQVISRKKPIEKNRVPASVEAAVVKMATELPRYGQQRVADELRKQGIIVSQGGVRSIWLRHNLATFKQRIKAIEPKKERTIISK